jgi:hypothetical protein
MDTAEKQLPAQGDDGYLPRTATQDGIQLELANIDHNPPADQFFGVLRLADHIPRSGSEQQHTHMRQV